MPSLKPFEPSSRTTDTLPKLFHMTSVAFERPSWEVGKRALEASMPTTEAHAKGVLGFWVSPRPESCEGFGPHCMEVTLKPGFRPVVIQLGNLVKLHRARQDRSSSEQLADYVELREQLLELGDVLFIEEAAGIGEVVVLNYDCIESLEEVDYSPRQRIPDHPMPEELTRLPQSGAADAAVIRMATATPRAADQTVADQARRPRLR